MLSLSSVKVYWSNSTSLVATNSTSSKDKFDTFGDNKALQFTSH